MNLAFTELIADDAAFHTNDMPISNSKDNPPWCFRLESSNNLFSNNFSYSQEWFKRL